MEYYVSVDIEADGPIPSQNSMISLGAAAFTSSGELLDVFKVNLQPRPGAEQDPETMKWWAKHLPAWDSATVNALEPAVAMQVFQEWLDSLVQDAEEQVKLVFVGYPVTYDFMFVYDYFIRYLGSCPFGFSGLDIKTLISAVSGLPYRESVKSSLPKKWARERPRHTHEADQDALEQGHIFLQLQQCLHGQREWV